MAAQREPAAAVATDGASIKVCALRTHSGFPKRRPIAAAALVALVSVGAARAEPARWDGSTEVSGYYDSDAVMVITPAVAAAVKTTSGWTANGSYLVDVVSAASVDIVSTASPRWTEVRHAGQLGAGYEFGAYGVGAHGSASFEPDYRSWSVGAEGSYRFANKQALLSLGYAYQHDTAGRTGTPFSEYALRWNRHTGEARLELVLDRATTLTTGADVMFEAGRQEKPYRYLPLFDAAVAPRVPPGASVELVNQLRLPGRISERVPDTRRRFAASVRLAHRFRSSTLQLWDRIYMDGWGMLANTTDARWIFDLSPDWEFWPAVRLHNQSAVTFWRRAYVGSIQDGRVDVPSFRTGDRELGRLWTATAGAGAAFALARDMRVSLELEGAYTDFPNTLYIDQRWATFAVAGFGLRFE